MTKHCFIFVCLIQVLLISCRAQVPGCTDPLANNYVPSATFNDGSCTYYPISVSPRSTFRLSDKIQETSGLIIWDGNLWTHNDNDDLKIYGLDTTDAQIEQTFSLEGVVNQDWEEISQDNNYIYIGDIGNNLSGNRTNLHILRVEKSSLLSGSPYIDTIWFSYVDQSDFEPKEVNQTDFDCEAFIVSEDSIYLFTKQWISAQTSVYRIPKVQGTYTALKTATHNVQGLVTGVTFLESSRLIVLCGYTSLLHPFLYLLYDYHGLDFFSGNKRRVSVSLPFHQVEGIASSNGMKYYLSNENFVLQPIANSPQKLHTFDLSGLLKDYIIRSDTGISANGDTGNLQIFPNPASNRIIVKTMYNKFDSDFKIINLSGKILLFGNLTGELTQIDISHLSKGLYIFKTGDNTTEVFRVIKL